MADSDDIYRKVGRKIRQARERSSAKLSQDALARRLGISRASVVNIEAGRQRAPLHLLWQIADLLGTNLTLLIPSREELLAPTNRVELEKEMMKQIQNVADDDSSSIKVLTAFVSKLTATVETPRSDRKSHENTKSRRKS
jgi:transcriptional regulator with XRE-family HTH domain